MVARENDTDELETLTVTIALDDDNELDDNYEAERERFNPDYLIGLPTRASEAIVRLPDNVLIQHLPPAAARVVQLRMNQPAVGTLKNWEFLAAWFGMNVEEIVDRRRKDNPTENILLSLRSFPLNRLLMALCDMNRVDVLIALHSHLNKLAESCEGTFTNSVEDDGFATTSRIEVSVAPVAADTNGQRLPTMPFILVTHYEQQKDIRRQFKYLLTNLRANAPKSTEIVDVDKCFDDRDLHGSLYPFFSGATQILLVLSEDYIRFVAPASSAPSDTKMNVKRHLHGLMDAEYMQNQSKNLRFRAVVLAGVERRLLPPGWPSNTVLYDFPDNFNELCERLFQTTN